MKKTLTTIFCLSVLSIATTSQADGLLMRLPADGTWAKYSVEADANGQEQSGEMTVKSVGKETVDEKECRWIELTLEGQGQKIQLKLLIPEEDFKAGGSPWTNSKKAFVDAGTGSPQELPDRDSPFLGPLMALLGGPLSDAEELAAAKVTTDAGEFECKGAKGGYQFKQDEIVLDVQAESRFIDDDKAGFGAVDYQFTFKIGELGEGNAHFKLKEVGEGAESAIDHTKVDGAKDDGGE